MHEPTSETAEQIKLKVVATTSPGGEEASELAGTSPGAESTKPNPEPVSDSANKTAASSGSAGASSNGASSNGAGSNGAGSNGAGSNGAGTKGTSSAACTNAQKQTPLQARHPSALQQILADPGASEEDWLAACYEMESHPNFKGFDKKPSALSSDMKRLLCSCTVMVLIGVSGVMMANNFTNTRPATPPAAPPAPIAPAADIDFGPYMANLQRQIKRSWYPPKSDASARAKVIFKVAQNGEMSYLRMQIPGPNDAFDRAAMAAVREASKSFRPLPVGSPNFVDIEFTFDYNVFDRATFN